MAADANCWEHGQQFRSPKAPLSSLRKVHISTLLHCSTFHIHWPKAIHTQAAGCRVYPGDMWLTTRSMWLFCSRSDKSSSRILLQRLGSKHFSSVSNSWVSTSSTTPNFPLPQLWNHLVMDLMLQMNLWSPRLLWLIYWFQARDIHEWCSVTPGRQALLSNTLWATALSPSQGASSTRLSFPWSQGRTKHKLRQQNKLWQHPSARQETGKVRRRVKNWTRKRQASNGKAKREKSSGGLSLCLQHGKHVTTCPAQFLLRKHQNQMWSQESLLPVPRLPTGKPLIHSFSPKMETCSFVARIATRYKVFGVFLNSITLETRSSQKRNSAWFYIFVSSSHVCRRNIWKPEVGRLNVKESVRTFALFETWNYWFFNISLQAWEAWVMVLEHVATLSPWSLAGPDGYHSPTPIFSVARNSASPASSAPPDLCSTHYSMPQWQRGNLWAAPNWDTLSCISVTSTGISLRTPPSG